MMWYIYDNTLECTKLWRQLIKRRVCVRICVRVYVLVCVRMVACMYVYG